MTPVDDDVAIRHALSDLTQGQPPVPAGRFQAVRQLASQRRRRQLIAAGVTVVAAVGVVFGALRLPGVLQAEPQARPVPSWALRWPDHRNGSVPQSVLDRAVLAWQYGAPTMPPDGGRGTVPAAGSTAQQVAQVVAARHVVWYVGQTIDHGQSVVVMFEAAGPNGRQLVVGRADASSVMHDQPAWSNASSPWILTAVPAPNPNRPPDAIGEYVQILDPGQTVHNWIVVLMPPSVHHLTSIAATPGGDRTLGISTTNGLAFADAGQLIAPVQLTGMQTDHGNLLGQPIEVGLPGHPGVPSLAPPPVLTEPPTFSSPFGGTGQGNATDLNSSFQAGRSQWAVVGACYGPQPLAIQVNEHQLGVIACNSQQHQVRIPAGVLRGHTLTLDLRTGNLTAWRVDLVSMR